MLIMCVVPSMRLSNLLEDEPLSSICKLKHVPFLGEEIQMPQLLVNLWLGFLTYQPCKEMIEH